MDKKNNNKQPEDLNILLKKEKQLAPLNQRHANILKMVPRIVAERIILKCAKQFGKNA